MRYRVRMRGSARGADFIFKCGKYDVNRGGEFFNYLQLSFLPSAKNVHSATCFGNA